MSTKTLAGAVSAFGADIKAKLGNAAVTGEPEDQLRAPLENLFRDLAQLAGHSDVVLVGETKLSELKSRPDFGVTRNNALVGFVEVKAPDKGVDPRRFRDPHDKKQWARLKALPNLIYTDGTGLSLWRDGELVGKPVVFDEDPRKVGAKLSVPEGLMPLLSDFLTWAPIPPPNAKKLADVSARLCRLLRDEVSEQLAEGNASLIGLAKDWRALLFPEADDDQFADGYAQAVTFGLLIARAYDIDLDGGIDLAALRLKKTNSLIGTALSVLTEDGSTYKALKTSLDTLVRVLGEVNWHLITKDKPDAWLYFYEDFLAVYDNELRKQTGSYYTPPEVVDAMVRLVDEVLRGPMFDRAMGLASPDVTIADPAAGTGTFLLGVMRRIAANVEADQGAGAVRPALNAAMKRLFGFELQFGPFAVAQLRVLAEMRALAKPNESDADLATGLNLFITNTLGNPFVEEEQLPQLVEAVARSRREANKIKREHPITVVIGNPPYKNKAAGLGSWVEAGGAGREPPLALWNPPAAWKLSTHTHHLRNLYVYFWRWATLKVFGSGWTKATGETPQESDGVICFISAAGFLTGPGFEKMREELRRDADAIWVVDCSPEGHQPDVPTRIFQGVQQPICIVLIARRNGKSREVPARVRCLSLPKKRRQGKFDRLAKLTLDDPEWREAPSAWRSPFASTAQGDWSSFPALQTLFGWSGSGVTPHRTWPIAPDTGTLVQRWETLKAEKDRERKRILFQEDHDRKIESVVGSELGGNELRHEIIEKDKAKVITPVRYAFRSFDRQWIVPDARLLSRGRPKLWAMISNRQVYLTAIERSAPRNGPAVTMTALIPDLDHYHGRGGRVYPLWADAHAKHSNVRTEALALLATTYGRPVTPEDVFAYVAGVMAHPAFTARFAADLVRPGLRVPLTADASLFDKAVEIGREVVWLHTYGERFADPEAGRPKGAPRLPKDRAPFIPAGGEIPPAPEPLPDAMGYDAGKRRLTVGLGRVENVDKAVFDYEVSGKNVLRQWFSYRKRDRSRPIIGDRRPPSPLETIQPDGWLHEYTTDLLDLLHVLGRLVDLEPRQAALLEAICEAPLIPPTALVAAGLMNEESGTAKQEAEPEPIDA